MSYSDDVRLQPGVHGKIPRSLALTSKTRFALDCPTWEDLIEQARFELEVIKEMLDRIRVAHLLYEENVQYGFSLTREVDQGITTRCWTMRPAGGDGIGITHRKPVDA